jgi:hypothetical protein
VESERKSTPDGVFTHTFPIKAAHPGLERLGEDPDGLRPASGQRPTARQRCIGSNLSFFPARARLMKRAPAGVNRVRAAAAWGARSKLSTNSMKGETHEEQEPASGTQALEENHRLASYSFWRWVCTSKSGPRDRCGDSRFGRGSLRRRLRASHSK